MKALRLHMKNIGPFLDEVIDFTALDDMFLVSGKTGSGKTTIFDAMIYALYGELTGTRKKSVGEFRSDFGLPSDESFVEFTFAINGRTFRVRRSVQCIYVNKNGREAVRPPEVTLEQFDAENGKFIVFNGRTNETNVKIAGIIGLSASEFTQIVLLPQGAFADFLHENSKNRRDTLAKLFPVAACEALIDRAKQKSSEYAAQRTIIEAQITELARDYDDQSARNELAELDAGLDALAERRKSIAGELENLRVSEDRTKMAVDAALQAEQWRSRKAELERQRPEIESVKLRASRAEQALLLGEYIRSRAAAGQRVRQLSGEKAAAEQELVSIEQTVSGFSKRKDEMAALQAIITGDQLLLQQLEARRQMLQKLQTAGEKAARTERDRTKAEQQLSAAEESAAGLLEAMKKRAGGACIAAEPDGTGILQCLLEKRQEAETAYAEAASCLETAKKAERLQARLSTVKSDLEKKTVQVSDIVLQMHNTQCCLDDYVEEQKRRERNDYACALAGRLEEGVPCPVCGSLEHPAPAVRLPASIDLEDKISTQDQNLAVLAEQKSRLETEQLSLEAELKQIQTSLDDLADAGFTDAGSARTGFEQAEQAVNTIRSVSADVRRLFAGWREKQKTVAQLADVLHAAERESSAAAAELETIEKQTDSGDTVEAVTGRIRDLTAAVDTAGKTFREYDAGFRKAENEKAACHMKVLTVSGNLAAAREEQKHAAGELEQRRAGTGFATVEEAEQALVPSGEIDRLRGRIEEWQAASDRITIQLESVKSDEKSSGLRVSLDKIREQAAEKRKAAEETDESVRAVTIKRTGLAEKIRKWSDLEQQRRDIEEKSAHYIKLAADLCGQNPKKIPFDAWILGMYFSEVVMFANPRFERISGGRYRFKISPDLSGGNSLRGLDLLVSDSYTGKDRDTATLSGGETFMASISLALALTDVVQNRSGGIRLDSLFIDEGFGTLDGEALDMAISILQDIRESRTVGVVSHVESMKSVIRSRIEVVKGPDGSHIRIV